LTSNHITSPRLLHPAFSIYVNFAMWSHKTSDGGLFGIGTFSGNVSV